MRLLISRILKKKENNELIYKTERDSQEANIWLPRRKATGKDKLGVWGGNIHTTVFKIDDQQGPIVGFPGGRVVKNPSASALEAGDVGSTPGLGRCPGEGNGNPLQYSCLGNPTDSRARRATVSRFAESRTRQSNCARRST